MVMILLALASTVEGACDAAKAGECTMQAHEDFPKAATAQNREQCEDVIRTYMECVPEDCRDIKSVMDLKEEFDKGCDALSQLEGRMPAKGTGFFRLCIPFVLLYLLPANTIDL